MGTKNDPGRFDCYSKAAPDEPIFILLGRDRLAPRLVRLWALLRAELGEDVEKTNEAYTCALAMEEYRKARKSEPQYGIAPTLPLIRALCLVEWIPWNGTHSAKCSSCGVYRSFTSPTHEDTCVLDDTLSRYGLDARAREEIRQQG